MSSLGGFKRRLSQLVQTSTPFIAYWYDKGHCIIKTSDMELVSNEWRCSDGWCFDNEATAREHCIKNHITAEPKLKKSVRRWKFTDAKRKHFMKLVSNLREKGYWTVYFVEYDGEKITAEGGFDTAEIM